MGFRHIAHAFLNWIGVTMTLMGFGYFLLTGWEANQSLGFQLGQAFNVWPPWVIEQMGISLAVFGIGVGILWWRLGKNPLVE